MLTYEAAVAEIEARGIMPDRPPGLGPMREALSRLDLSRWIDPGRVILVAGTNGKGSVCATLEALLLAAGRRVGLYTSPHLLETTERIRIGGRDISRDRFLKAYSRIRGVCEGISLSHFETLTLMAAWEFFGDRERTVDWAVFEVGLGGRWDATNALPHGRCVITSLGLDHQNLLGDSIEEIAANKFDIVMPGSRVVHSPLPEAVRTLAREVQCRTGSFWTPAVAHGLRTVPPSIDEYTLDPDFFLETPWGQARLALPGARGAENAATALTLFQSLGFNPADFLHALERVHWKGRMQRIRLSHARCPVYLSGDHNPQGIGSLVDLLAAYPRRRLHLLVGVGKDKDLDGILRGLFGVRDASVYLTESPFRGRRLEDYGEWLTRASGAWRDPEEALERVLGLAGEGDRIVVTGSLYLVGRILRRAI